MIHRNLIPLGSSPSDVKSHNLSAVLLALRRHDYISRVRLAELTTLSTTTITNPVSGLLGHGIIVEDSGDKLDHRRGVGRPRTALRLVPEARYALAVHIGDGGVRVVVADLRAHLLTHISQVHALEKSAKDVLVEIAGLVEEAIAEGGIDRRYVVGMGVMDNSVRAMALGEAMSDLGQDVRVLAFVYNVMDIKK